MEAAQEAVDAALAHHQACREAIRGLSIDDHCYRPKDGAAHDTEQPEALLAARFAVIDQVADRAVLSQRCCAMIDRARRVTVDLVATIGSVHPELALRLASLDIPSALRAEIATRLVSCLYLQQVASRDAGTGPTRPRSDRR
ncbi:MAG: hypothetical protein JXX28_17470 [Deltaproteobacteria bacterium]|nr:hypothetical protein [Deltaproteobacteria bacterium]